jgi:hypothetical protein
MSAIVDGSATLTNVVVEDDGGTIEWPDFDVSFKARSSRENGKLGGRPRKVA